MLLQGSCNHLFMSSFPPKGEIVPQSQIVPRSVTGIFDWRGLGVDKVLNVREFCPKVSVKKESASTDRAILLPKFRNRHAVHLLEGSGEVAAIGEVQLISDFLQTEVCVPSFGFYQTKFGLQKIIRQADARLLFEVFGEIGFG